MLVLLWVSGEYSVDILDRSKLNVSKALFEERQDQPGSRDYLAHLPSHSHRIFLAFRVKMVILKVLGKGYNCACAKDLSYNRI